MKRPHPVANLGKWAHPPKTRPKPVKIAAAKSVATKIRKASRYG